MGFKKYGGHNDGSLTLTASNGGYQIWKKERGTLPIQMMIILCMGALMRTLCYDPNATADDGSCKGIEGTWVLVQDRLTNSGNWSAPDGYSISWEFHNNNQMTYEVSVEGQTVTSEGYYCIDLVANIFSQNYQNNITNCSDCLVSTTTSFQNFVLEGFDTFTIGTVNTGSNDYCNGATQRYQRQ